MRNLKLANLLAVVALACSGCSICPPGYLDDYATLGGKHPRTNPTSGRVGSILSDHEVVSGTIVDEYYSPEAEFFEDDYYGSISDDQNVGGYIEEVDPIYGDGTNHEQGVIVLGDDW